MCVTTKVIVLVLIPLIAACNNSSQPEQRKDISELIAEAETSSDPATEFEKAKLECADKGGEWVWYDHGDELAHYFNTMRCWSLDDPPRRPGDGSWEEPGLLRYDVLVRYYRETHKITNFVRLSQTLENK